MQPYSACRMCFVKFIHSSVICYIDAVLPVPTLARLSCGAAEQRCSGWAGWAGRGLLCAQYALYTLHSRTHTPVATEEREEKPGFFRCGSWAKDVSSRRVYTCIKKKVAPPIAAPHEHVGEQEAEDCQATMRNRHHHHLCTQPPIPAAVPAPHPTPYFRASDPPTRQASATSSAPRNEDDDAMNHGIQAFHQRKWHRGSCCGTGLTRASSRRLNVNVLQDSSRSWQQEMDAERDGFKKRSQHVLLPAFN